MLKHLELSTTNSCLNRADDNEPIFVLLARDIAAPRAIRNWCGWRILANKNAENDPQITEALNLAAAMELYRSGAEFTEILPLAMIPFPWYCSHCARTGEVLLPASGPGSSIPDLLRALVVAHRDKVTEQHGICTDMLMPTMQLNLAKG